MIELNNISKKYENQVQALNDINLKFENNGLVFIVGKSGNGKSTLLNIIGQMDKPSGGFVRIDDINLTEVDSNVSAIYKNNYFGFVYQEFYFDKNLNVLDNILLPIKGNDKKIDDIKKLADQLEISEYLDRNVNELSGGQRQRVQILRALVNNPSVILADEPTGSLDKITKEEIYKLFIKLSKEHLVIIVSHDLEAAKIYSDRLITISKGNIVSDIINKKEYFEIDNKAYSPMQLLEYLGQFSGRFTLDIEKKFKETKNEKLKTFIDKGKLNLDNKYKSKYAHHYFKKNKSFFVLNSILTLVLISLSMFIIMILSWSYTESKIKYVNSNFFDNYILYKNTEYTSIFYDNYNKRLFSGKDFYNKLAENGNEITPVYNDFIYLNTQGVNVNIIEDDSLLDNELAISDYFSEKNNLNVSDIINYENKDYVISKVFETEYTKYKKIINSNDIKYISIIDEFKNYRINYIKIKEINLNDRAISLSNSNFMLNNDLKQNLAYKTLIESNIDTKFNLNDNEICISKQFANQYGLDESILNKKLYFKNLRDKKYNDYYDDIITLHDYYQDGFYIKDIIDETGFDYLIDNEKFLKIKSDYKLYEKPEFYLAKNYDVTKNEGFEVIDYNLDNIRINYEGVVKFKPIFYTLLIIFTFSTILANYSFILQLISKNINNIGLLKSVGYNNKEINKIFGNIVKKYIIITCILSVILYLAIFGYVEIQKYNSMYYNAFYHDSLSLNPFVSLCVFICSIILLCFLFLRNVNKKEPIQLIKK